MADPENPVEETRNPEHPTYEDESVIWSGKPSQVVNLPTYLWWGGISIALLICKSMWDSGYADEYPAIVDTIVGYSVAGVHILSVLSCLYAYLTVKYTHTTITRNKILEVRGITRIFRREMYCEISDVKDVLLMRSDERAFGALRPPPLDVPVRPVNKPISALEAEALA